MNVHQERLRGLKEGRQQFELLATHWPHAFPRKSHLVRPLSSGAIAEISEKLNWPRGYTRGVLASWKFQSSYCRAILHHTERVRLDGSLSEEAVSDRDRKKAQEQLDRMTAAKAARSAHLREKQEAASNS